MPVGVYSEVAVISCAAVIGQAVAHAEQDEPTCRVAAVAQSLEVAVRCEMRLILFPSCAVARWPQSAM